MILFIRGYAIWQLIFTRMQSNLIETGCFMANSPRDLSIEISIDGDSWQVVESLEQAGPQDEVFTLDLKTGEIRFGDGQHGRRPEAGSSVSTTYRYGVSESGNIASFTWKTPASGSPDRRLLTWQLQPGSITLRMLSGDSNCLRWRLFSWLCRLICQSPWRVL